MNYKSEVVKFSYILEHKRLVNAMEGNVSVYDRKNDLLYITPSGMSKSLLAEEDIAVMDKEGKQVGGKYKASSEYRLHMASYLVREDINGIVHSHAPILTSYAICNKSLRMDYYPEFVGMFCDIPVLPFGMPGTEEIYNGIETLLKERNVILLQNHGVVAVGTNLSRAVRFLEAAENSARIAADISRIGEPVPLSSKDHESCVEHFKATFRGEKATTFSIDCCNNNRT